MDVIEDPEDEFDPMSVTDATPNGFIKDDVWLLRCHMKTEYALLVSIEPISRDFDKVWIPGSQVQILREFIKNYHQSVVVRIPDWLGRKITK